MKIKLRDIINATNAEAGQQSKFQILLSKDLLIKVSYKINRLIGKLEPILKSYEDKRNELVKKYGEKIQKENSEPTYSVTDPEKLKLFTEKWNELVEIEEDLDFEKINIADMGDITLKPTEVIDWMFE